MANWSLKKYVNLAKGFTGRGRNNPKAMMNRVQKSLLYNYRSRKVRPRLLRTEWIQTISAAVKEHRINYSRFIFALNHSNIYLDRKILADLAVNEPLSFKSVVDELKVQGKMQEQIDPVTLDQAYERGLIANNVEKAWFKKGLHEGYKIMGYTRQLTQEEKAKIRKGAF